MRWFQIKEQSAGKKRLVLSWYLYKIFGKRILYIISALVSFFTFVFSKKIRGYSRKYFSVIEPKSGIKPSLFNIYKHIHSYADSLVDKIIVYSGDYKVTDIIFDSDNDKKQLFDDIDKNNGIFFICDHIGNIEILQSFLLSKDIYPDISANIFMSHRQSQIFNSFLNDIKVNFPAKLYAVEDIGLTTGIEIKEETDKGNIVFIAGDRLAENNDKKSNEAILFNKKIMLPKGAFKLAKLIDVPTYFISALKIGNKYNIFLEKQTDLSEKVILEKYSKYLERTILNNPFQFYHFYDFFN